jgi:hypothetical protein
VTGERKGEEEERGTIPPWQVGGATWRGEPLRERSGRPSPSGLDVVLNSAIGQLLWMPGRTDEKRAD